MSENLHGHYKQAAISNIKKIVQHTSNGVDIISF